VVLPKICIGNLGCDATSHADILYPKRADVGICPYIRNKTKNIFAYENFYAYEKCISYSDAFLKLEK